jgi:hypothetical protein
MSAPGVAKLDNVGIERSGKCGAEQHVEAATSSKLTIGTGDQQPTWT